MGRVTKEHAIGRGQGQRVAGALFPRLMLRTRHELLALNPGKLAERAIRGFIAPDALGRRIHRITAIAFFIITIVLVAMDDNLIAHFPARDFRSPRPKRCPTRQIPRCDRVACGHRNGLIGTPNAAQTPL